MNIWPRTTEQSRGPIKPKIASGANILAPYTTPAWYQRHRGLCLTGLALFSSFYGLIWAAAGQYALTLLMVPILAVFILLVWALPESGPASEGSLRTGLFVYFIGLLCWPDYIAIALPGLPWITVIRLIGVPLALIMLIKLSSSEALRAKLSDIVQACPVMWKLVAAFAVICLISIGLSAEPRISMSKFFVAQVNWTAIFFLSCIVFSQPGMVKRLATMLWIMAVFVCAIGIWEYRLGHVPWAGHIPSFLVIPDESAQRAMSATGRAGTDIYRVRSKFATSLGLAEYLAIATPFIFHIMACAPRLITRILAFATLPIIIYTVHLTDSRLAAIGLFVSMALYILVWGVIRWRSDKESIIGAAVTLAYPITFAIMFAATLFVPRIRVEIWGDGSQQASTDARIAMYHAGIPMILKNPLGYGIGQGGDTLGFRNQGGILTIDTYYLAAGLEFGVIGFLVYFGMHLYAIWKAGMIGLARQDGEFAWMGVAAIALLNFVVSKSVFSSLENHPLVFALLGLIVAMAYRAQQPVPPVHVPKAAGPAARPARQERTARSSQ